MYKGSMRKAVEMYLGSSLTAVPKHYVFRHAANRLGYDILKTSRFGLKLVPHGRGRLGVSQVADVKRFITNANPLIIDVGANVGQTVFRYKDAFPKCKIHSFEASPATFDTLRRNALHVSDVSVWNKGVGATSGVMSFQENEHDEFSSFLDLGDSAIGRIKRRTEVQMTTLDAFCAEQSITPDFTHVCQFLLDAGYRLVTFYPIAVQADRAGWTDALFIYDPPTAA
jgi:FkbM family methyltransferase